MFVEELRSSGDGGLQVRPSAYLLIWQGPGSRPAADWLVDDVDDPIGRRHVLLDDRQHSAGVVQEDELLCGTKPVRVKVPEGRTVNLAKARKRRLASSTKMAARAGAGACCIIDVKHIQLH